jgi:putative transposase
MFSRPRSHARRMPPRSRISAKLRSTSSPRRRMASRPAPDFSRTGNVWDNAAMESFFSSLKAARIGKKVYRTRDEARADVFDYIERFYNTVRRHSTIGYLSPVEFERKVGLA